MLYGNPFRLEMYGSILRMSVPESRSSYVVAEWALNDAIQALQGENPVIQVELESEAGQMTVFLPKTAMFLSMTRNLPMS